MEKVRIQDDLYQYVNDEWLEKAVIPEDRPLTGGFSELDEEVEKLLMKEFAEFAEGKKEIPLAEISDAVKLYKKIIDTKRRNKEGIKPVLADLHQIMDIKTLADFNKHVYEINKLGFNLPIEFGVAEDMADATKHCFIITGPSLILPDTTYYDNPQGKALLGVYQNMASQILAYTDLSKDDQIKYLEDTLYFDELISKRVKSQLEWADYVKNYNPMPLDEVCSYLQPFDFKGLLNAIYPQQVPNTIVVYDPRAIKEFNLYFNEETFIKYLHWAYVKKLLSSTAYLSMDLAQLGTIYRRSIIGVKTDPVIEKQAYQMVSKIYSEPIGVYYGRTYFGEEAKKDVIDLVKKIIETYKLRMKKNNFLKEETKLQAIKKLSTIEIKMGYPDFVHDFYKTLTINENDSYYQSITSISQKREKHELDKLYQPVDRSEWAMPGHMVNACYNPTANDITFPAAILQKPFYSLNQSVSENLGGIGAVIGHEISHAFDNNGAHFDENGNLKNWWAEEDFAAFKDLTKQMIDQFDGMEFHGGKVNGELVVSENIADNGGMGVTLEIMNTIKDANYQAYFMNWAKIWCQKAKEEFVQYLLINDVHSPAGLRANIPPRNFDEWYIAFDVKETDKMYIPKEKRISIW